MKCKVGDRARIKNSIEHCDHMAYVMLEYQGRIMTVTNRGKGYIWQNPKNINVDVGYAVMADTKYGEQPIIVTDIKTGKKKDVKQHRCITRGIWI